MVYRAIGVMSGSSLDGLDIVMASFEESRGQWTYEIKAANIYEYSADWKRSLQQAPTLSAYDYLKLHSAYGTFIGEQINAFIQAHNLYHQVQLISSHGHTIFHAPANGFTAQLGNGASIAAATGINVVSDLRAMDVALGGQGAPIVPVGEKLLFGSYNLLLNLGGIANLSCKTGDSYTAFDVCPANAILNKLAAQEKLSFDANGALAATGTVHEALLDTLNDLDYYAQPSPKSLDNSWGTDTVLPIIESYSHLSTADALRTYAEHIAVQVANAAAQQFPQTTSGSTEIFTTGGGAFNTFLVQLINDRLAPLGYTLTVPAPEVVNYKEALIMALLGLLRWREENTVLQSVTGASRSSIGGAVWMGQDA